MSRKVSLNARLALDAVGTDEVEVVLAFITHPETNQVIRLSTDPTERLSLDPLEYGTRSNWLGSNPAAEPFKFVLMSAVLPDDGEGTPPTAQIVLEAVDNETAMVLRSTTRRATVSLAVVLASSPDVLEDEHLNFRLISAEGSADSITLILSRDPIASEPWPADRMTRDRFPGLHP